MASFAISKSTSVIAEYVDQRGYICKSTATVFTYLGVPYEVTFYTGDVDEAGTDSQVFIKVFGVKGSSSELYIDKMSERFERGTVDLIKVGFDLSLAHFAKLGRGYHVAFSISFLFTST